MKNKNPEQSNEGFYLDDNGNRDDAALFAADGDFEWGLDYQIMGAKDMREKGYSDESIKSCYPLGLAELNK